jgi:ABC-2 type transport system permease protein
MKMFWHELRSTYKGLLDWIAGVLFFQLSGYSKYEGFRASSSSSLNSIANAFPKPLAALFGMYDLNITTLIGYFGILYLYFALIAAIHAGLLGAGIISKEERDKTSEFLYTRPISRTKALTAKILAGGLEVMILFLIIAVSSVIAVGIVNSHSFDLTSQIMNLMWGILVFQIFFFSLGILFAGIFKHPKLPTLAVTVAIVGSYFVSALSQLNDSLNWLRFVTPFRWMAAPSIIYANHVGYGYVALTLGLSILFVFLGYVFYNKRDLTVA